MKTRDVPRAFAPWRKKPRRYTRSVLNEEHRRYLRNLPLKATVAAEGIHFLMCHAAPPDPLFEYRQEESPLWLADEVAPGIGIELVGHTHIPFRRSLEPAWWSIPEASGSQSMAVPRPATRFGRTAGSASNRLPMTWSGQSQNCAAFPCRPQSSRIWRSC